MRRYRTCSQIRTLLDEAKSDCLHLRYSAPGFRPLASYVYIVRLCAGQVEPTKMCIERLIPSVRVFSTSVTFSCLARGLCSLR